MTLEDFENVSKKLGCVEFINCDFRDAIARVKPNDFMYLDPPYAPEKKTSFVGYTKDGFNLEDHETLFKLIKEGKSNFVMSNSSTELVKNTFSDYKIVEIKAKRTINSKKPGSTTTEVIVSSNL